MAAVTLFFDLFHTFLQLKLYLYLSLIMLGGWIITAMESKLKSGLKWIVSMTLEVKAFLHLM